MRQNMLTLYRDKTEIVVFSKSGEWKIEQFHYNGIFIEPKTSCRYLGIMIDNNLNFDIQLNKTLTKMANAIRSIYLVRHFLPLKARIGLFKSLVLSHLNFSAIFLQSLSVMSLQRVNRQINWGIKVCHLRKKFDSARDLLLKDKILPAEHFIKNVCLLNFLTSSHNIKRAVEKPKTPHSGFLKSTNWPKTPELSSTFQRISAIPNGVTGHWLEIFLGSGINCQLKSEKRKQKINLRKN